MDQELPAGGNQRGGAVIHNRGGARCAPLGDLYTLLVAFVCLASAAIFTSAGGIWTTANSRLTQANTSTAS